MTQPALSVAVIDPTVVIEIAQYVVEGTLSFRAAMAAIKTAGKIDDTAPIVRIEGHPMRVWLRGHYYQHHPEYPRKEHP